MKTMGLGHKITKMSLTALLLIIVITMIAPFIWMISASMKYEADVFTFPIQWIPKRFHLIENYSEVWMGKYNLLLYYWNSIKITVISTILQVAFSAMAGYAFAKINFKFKNLVFTSLVATLMIPDQVTLVPKFFIARWMGLYDTHTFIILILSFSVYGMFLMRQYMVTIPDALLESAKIDGANHLRIFAAIMLPMSKPIIATLAILKFVWTWNDYQDSLVFLKSRELFTLQLGIKQFATQSGAIYSLIMAAAVCAIVPLIIIFITGQKYILEGMTAGAIKG
jgi:multiple sugar transport system permease protein